MPKLTIIRGVPGSGKSTLAKSLGIFHIEADMYHMKDGKYQWSVQKISAAHSWCQRTVAHAMQEGMDVVVSNTFVKKSEMKFYIHLSVQHEYELEIITMRNNYGNIHNVPQETIDRMKANFEE